MGRAESAGRQKLTGAFRGPCLYTSLPMGRVAAVSVLYGLVAFAPLAGGAELAPHRAIYALSLGEVADGSAISDVTGLLVVELIRTCEGASLRQAAQIEIATTTGASIRTRMLSSVWESAGGTELRFETDTEMSGVVQESFYGTAILASGGGSVAYTDPAGGGMDLPEGTRLAVTHLSALLDAAAREPIDAGYVFDGGGPDTLSYVSAAIGPGAEAQPASAVAFAALAERPSWRLNVAYFPADQSVSSPDQEMGFRLYDGGIVDELDLAFGRFRIDGKITTLDLLPSPDC